ncbi:MAG: hypothetical protein ACK5B9_04800 [Flavobacteriia bacterium]|jgi:hypothetical protein
MKYLKKIILSLVYCLLFQLNYSQNLVPNPSFEMLERCFSHSPESVLPINFIWWEPNGNSSADIFCEYNNQLEFNNKKLSDAPHGNIYLGLALTNRGCNILGGEMIQTSLNKPLIKKQTYFLSFKVRLFENSAYETSDYQLGFCKKKSLQKIFFNFYAVKTALKNQKGNFISDKSWTKMSGVYKARGFEKFVTLGARHSHFDLRTIENRDSLNKRIPHAYYLFDDIFVIKIPENYDQIKKDSFQIALDKYIPLFPKKGDSIELKSADFTLNSFKIDDSIKMNVSCLIDYLNTNPFIIIELAMPFSSNYIASKRDKLLLHREEELIRYFEENGISSSRIHFNWTNQLQNTFKVTILDVLY